MAVACCGLYQAGEECDCAEPWRENFADDFVVGMPVRIVNAVEKGLPFEYGTVVQVSIMNQGCLVRALDSNQSFGWSFAELEPVRQIPHTRFDRDLEVP